MTTPLGPAATATPRSKDRRAAERTQSGDRPGAPVEETAAAGPSIHVIRARKLLFGGLIGGMTAAAMSMVLFTIVDGTRGLASAALASAMVLFFYGVGQLVMVAFADAGARTLLAVSLASYTGRVVVLGLVLLLYNKHKEVFPELWPMAIFVTTIAVVVGWIAVELWVFNRLRIGIYDSEYDPPAVQEDQQ